MSRTEHISVKVQHRSAHSTFEWGMRWGKEIHLRDKNLMKTMFWDELLAEAVGFEPTVEFPPRWFSRPEP